MAGKKKPVVDLTSQELSFPIDGLTAKLIAFNPNTMTLRIDLYEDGARVKSDSSFPFAHLPKPLKKVVKPL
jgi:hypothetical protein